MFNFLKPKEPKLYKAKVEMATLDIEPTIDNALSFETYDNGMLTVNAVGKIYVFPKGRWIRFSMEEK